MTDFNTLRIDLIRRLSLCGAWDGKLYWYKDTIQLLKKMMQFVPPKNNADRIRAMSDEELAKFLSDEIFTIPECNQLDVVTRCDEDCNKCWLDWLRQGCGC